jgi:two-component system response regulator PilR (NtrC family)
MSLEKLTAEIGRLAPSRATVLLRGGGLDEREQVARLLHERSPRANEPFVAVDCAALEGEFLERHLFGGPYDERPGAGIVHEMAGGTLYVAAVDGLPRVLQPRFLGFLDGDRRVRVVAHAGAALEAEIAAGRFRADLGERLLLVQLVLPNG